MAYPDTRSTTALLAEAASAPVRRLRALVVEDSEADFELVVAMLTRAGWRVDAERVDERDAMRLALKTREWDVVIADHSLPRFSGEEALELTKECGFDAPFILVSGSIGEDAAVAALHAGADDCINKASLSRLVPAVLRSLAAAGARRERRNAERALRDSLDQLTALVTASPLAIVGLDLEGRVTLWNPAAERIFGWHAAQVLGRTLPAVGSTQSEDFRTIREWLPGKGVIETETRRLRADGTEVEVSMSVAAQHDDQGRSIGTIALIADIGDRKRAERQVTESREQLRALSAHMGKAIETERANFARELHDQVGGTLTALRSELDGLRKRIESNPALAKRVQSMDSLIDTAMKASIAMSRALRPSMLDHGVFPALEWQAQEFAERTGTACRVACNDEGATLDIEQSTALYRIFQEALTNVAKHAQAARVDAELFINASTVTLEVRDDGAGLAGGALAKRESFGIRGMMERVRGLGGWLDVSGQPGQGTTLMVSIPRRKPKPSKNAK